MKAYLELAKQAMNNFCMVKVIQVAWLQNRHADSLTMLASSIAEEIPRLIKVELVPEPSIKVAGDVGAAGIEVTVITTFGPCWMDPIIDFLAKDRVSGDKREANKIRRVAARYWLSKNRKLYRNSFGGPYLLYLHPERMGQLLAELYDGVCGSHVGGRSLAH